MIAAIDPATIGAYAAAAVAVIGAFGLMAERIINAIRTPKPPASRPAD